MGKYKKKEKHIYLQCMAHVTIRETKRVNWYKEFLIKYNKIFTRE